MHALELQPVLAEVKNCSQVIFVVWNIDEVFSECMSMAKAWEIFKTERSEDSAFEIWQSEDDIISFFFTIYLVLKTEDLNTALILDVKIQNMSSCAWSP